MKGRMVSTDVPDPQSPPPTNPPSSPASSGPPPTPREGLKVASPPASVKLRIIRQWVRRGSGNRAQVC